MVSGGRKPPLAREGFGEFPLCKRQVFKGKNSALDLKFSDEFI